MSLGVSPGSGVARGGFGVSAGTGEAILQQQILAAQQASQERTFNTMMSSSMPYTGNVNTGMHPNLTPLNTVRAYRIRVNVV
jgi:aspartyl aminopeptidase